MKNYFKKNEIIVNGIHSYITRNGQITTKNGKDIFCKCCKTEGLNPSNKKPEDQVKAKNLGCIFKINKEHTKIICQHCGREIMVTETYETNQKKVDAYNEKAKENLRIVEKGSDWECGLKFYGLSANIEYEDWLKIKEHFQYYHRGWSKGQELEWNYGEPSGWLTRNPLEVEKILIENGLIKPENTLKARL